MNTFVSLLLVIVGTQAAKIPALKARAHGLGETKVAKQSLDCYDGQDGQGDSLHAIDYIPALRNYNMDNRIGSCCFSGIWLLYADENFNGYNIGASNWWGIGDNYCINVPPQFNNLASSLRFTGAPDDWRYDTINFYFNDYFIGDEEFTYGDKPQLNYNNRAKSIIVTGCSAWTIYSLDNYRGNSMCLFPSDSQACLPGLYPTSEALGILAGQVSSAKRGCLAREKSLPVNRGVRTIGNGTSGFFPMRTL